MCSARSGMQIARALSHPRLVPKGAELRRPRAPTRRSTSPNAKPRPCSVIVRPGDLPSDDDEAPRSTRLAVAGFDGRKGRVGAIRRKDDDLGDIAPWCSSIADHLDLFALCMRLEPLESVKQNPNCKGNWRVYHSLGAFQLARDLRPYDEEFLLAATDAGKVIEPQTMSRPGWNCSARFRHGADTRLIEHGLGLAGATTLEPPFEA